MKANKFTAVQTIQAPKDQAFVLRSGWHTKANCGQKTNTVAIIDDDPGIRDALEHLLSSHGYHTELYPSAEEFISAVHLTKALCLVVDVQLGGISGLELGRHLFADGFNIPIIFMTGSRDEAIRRQASDFGCAAFLRKPFVAAQLVEAITKAIDTALDWK